jgi:signal transduction histidine kinase
MARALLETPSYRRGGLRTMTLAIGAMALTSVLYVLSPRDDPRIDILSIGFTIAALIVFFGERYSDFADLEIIRFREAIGGMDDAVIILGPSMEVVYANGPGRRLLEQNAEFFWERVKARGLRVPSGPNRWETAMVIDGEPRHFILSTSDILRQGKPIGMVMVFHDISNRKGLEEELRRANRSIRLLNEVLRHDLMNDMTALWGYMELLEATELNDRQRHLVGKLIERARSAEAQLSFAAEQERNLATTTAWHDMQAIITKVLGQVDMNGIRTESHLEGLQVLADPKLENVFHVLADNTVRHGRKATRAVVRAENTETGLEIIWEDDGVGVPTESKENIFSKGVGDNTGLGLYLAREILATTGFTISEEGEPGKGARFVIRVPSGWFTWRTHPS